MLMHTFNLVAFNLFLFVITLSSLVSFISADSGSRLHDVKLPFDSKRTPGHNVEPRDCILRLSQSFGSVADVWEILTYLMPISVAESVDTDDYSYLYPATSDRHDVVSSWLKDLVTVVKFQDNDGSYRYTLTLNNQECDQPVNSRHKMAADEYTTRLRKMGVDYHLVKIVKSASNMGASADKGLPDDDSDDELIAPTRTAQYSEASLEPAFGYKRRHARRHAAVRATPIMNPGGPHEGHLYSTVTILPELIESRQLEVRPDEALTRIVPTLTTPTFALPATSITLLPGQNNVRPSNTRRLYKANRTPVPEPGFPSDYYDLSSPVVAPTPSFRFVPADKSTIFTSDILDPTPVVSTPTETAMPEENVDENEVDPMPEPPTTVEARPTSATGFTGNSAPVVKKRVRKLSIYAGKWWKFPIPDETFFDAEDGGTRSLKLGFFLEDQKVPSADYWIQFDTENQFLYAFPTEANIGKHIFHLMAIDSSGQMATELLEIHVRQAQTSRSYHHVFFLYDVTWDQVTYPILISATERLLLRIAQHVYGDKSIDGFAVQTMEATAGVGARRNYTISWTNDTLPQYPCPKTQIHRLYGKLGDLSKPSDGVSVPPSERLSKVLGSEFKLRGAGLRMQANCGGSSATEIIPGQVPEKRNSLGLIQVKQGQVLIYQIPEDTFVSAKGGTARELELSLLTVDGHNLPREGPLSFNADTMTISILFTEKMGGPKPHSREYKLMAKEPGSSATAYDVFVVEFLSESERIPHGFEITMDFLYQTDGTSDELLFDRKIWLMWQIATKLLSDANPSELKVLSFKKYKYNGHSNGGNDLRRRRDAPTFYYELVWTNRTKPLLAHGGCPSELIKNNILHRIFNEPTTIDQLSTIFEPDFRLLYTQFKPTSKCSDYLMQVDMGDQPVVMIPPPTPRSPTGATGTGSTWATPIDANAVDEAERELYMSSILPALITIAVMLIVALVIVVILVRYRRQQEKQRFDVHGMSVTRADGFPTERDAFLGKGRVPVIFESEIQQQQLLARQHANQSAYGFYSPVVMQPPASPAGNGGGGRGGGDPRDPRDPRGYYGHQQTPPMGHHQMHHLSSRSNTFHSRM
ncbi:Dystroglycan [Halotydeus destructor]|nr:Dystroglycan [Halotydeus destructor]